jgi:hypothetical protein
MAIGSPFIATPAVMPADADARGADAWDPIWGFVKAGQSVTVEYGPDGSSVSTPIYTIDGILSPAFVEEGSTITKMYEALEKLVSDAAAGTPPENIREYGTSTDTRCVKLPTKTWSTETYAMPTSLEVKESSWPTSLAYSASFEKPRKPRLEVSIGSFKLASGTVKISAEKPRLKRVVIMRADGDRLHYSGWTPRRAEINGRVPRPPAPSGVPLVAGMGWAHDEMTKDTMDLVIAPMGENASGDPFTAEVIVDKADLGVMSTGRTPGFEVSIAGDIDKLQSEET